MKKDFQCKDQKCNSKRIKAQSIISLNVSFKKYNYSSNDKKPIMPYSFSVNYSRELGSVILELLHFIHLLI